MSLCLCVSFESESEREKERVERWSKGTSKGPVCSFVLSRRLSGGAVLVSKAFESQVLSDAFPLFFFFPSLLTDFRRTRKERRTKECRRGQWDGRKSASNALKTNEIDR